MHKNNFGGRKFSGVIDERLACGMRAELKLVDIAADALGRFVGVEGNLPICSSVP
jgi:lipid-binding SYLF domain-containing protein